MNPLQSTHTERRVCCVFVCCARAFWHAYNMKTRIIVSDAVVLERVWAVGGPQPATSVNGCGLQWETTVAHLAVCSIQACSICLWTRQQQTSTDQPLPWPGRGWGSYDATAPDPVEKHQLMYTLFSLAGWDWNGYAHTHTKPIYILSMRSIDGDNNDGSSIYTGPSVLHVCQRWLRT